MQLHSGTRTLTLPRKTSIVGVINVTPDSFVAESRAERTEDIIALATQYLDGGADMLEVGGESTGPHSRDVSVTEEMARVLPAIQLIRRNFPESWIVVDTYKAEIAHAAISEGADMINDVTAGRGDAHMFSVLAKAGCPAILMYSKDSSARTTVAETRYDDVISTITSFVLERMHAAREAGVSQIIIDPGLGHFVSADPSYSWEILTKLSELCSLAPLLVSPARKSFLSGKEQLPTAERLSATLAASCLASINGASFIRTHDVRQTRAALDAVAGIFR